MLSRVRIDRGCCARHLALGDRHEWSARLPHVHERGSRVHERPAVGAVTNHFAERGNSIQDSVTESARAAAAFILIHHL